MRLEKPTTGESVSLSQIEQITTRGNGVLEKQGQFAKSDIGFDRVLQHLKIHQDGEVAGSQFNGNVFATGEELVTRVHEMLPDTLDYDQFGRAELTLTLEGTSTPIGWSGVKSLSELKGAHPDMQLESRPRIPGGESAVVDGVEGAWYPESAYTPGVGVEVVLDENGAVKNPHGKFEPNAQIATIDADNFEASMRTNKITLIIQKDRETEKPVVLTVFPGDNAPAFPAKIDTEGYKASTLGSTNETQYWSEHAFIQKGEKKEVAVDAAAEAELTEKQEEDRRASEDKLSEVRSNLNSL